MVGGQGDQGVQSALGLEEGQEHKGLGQKDLGSPLEQRVEGQASLEMVEFQLSQGLRG